MKNITIILLLVLSSFVMKAQTITIKLENKSEMNNKQEIVKNSKLTNASFLAYIKTDKAGQDYLEFYPTNIEIGIKGRYDLVSTSKNNSTGVILFNLANKYEKQIQLALHMKNGLGFITYNVSNDGKYYKNVVGGKYTMK